MLDVPLGVRDAPEDVDAPVVIDPQQPRRASILGLDRTGASERKPSMCAGPFAAAFACALRRPTQALT